MTNKGPYQRRDHAAISYVAPNVASDNSVQRWWGSAGIDQDDSDVRKIFGVRRWQGDIHGLNLIAAT